MTSEAVILWELAGLAAYVTVGAFTYGFFVLSWDDDELAVPAAIFWPVGVSAWVLCIVGAWAVSKGEATANWLAQRAKAKKVPEARVRK